MRIEYRAVQFHTLAHQRVALLNAMATRLNHGETITPENYEDLVGESMWLAKAQANSLWAQVESECRSGHTVLISGAPNELFDLFISRRTDRAGGDQPPKLVSNISEGNADIAFVCRGLRYELATNDSRPGELALLVLAAKAYSEDV